MEPLGHQVQEAAQESMEAVCRVPRGSTHGPVAAEAALRPPIGVGAEVGQLQLVERIRLAGGLAICRDLAEVTGPQMARSRAEPGAAVGAAAPQPDMGELVEMEKMAESKF